MRKAILRSRTLTIDVGEHWKVEADDSRRYIAIAVQDNSAGFDIAFTPPNTLPEPEEWLERLGNATNTSTSPFVIDTGCASEIHFRDTDNVGRETISFLSDVPVVLTQLS